MKLQRFFIEEKVGEATELFLEDAALAHQLKNVFRYNTGNQVVVFDNSGDEFLATISDLEKGGVSLSNIEKNKGVSVDLRPKLHLTLYCSIIKKQNFELVVEKCTELGISEIVPVISERSEKKAIDPERLRRIIKEASEQSGRTILPRLHETLTLAEAVNKSLAEQKSNPRSRAILALSQESDLFELTKELNETVVGSIKPRKSVDIFIGPEGGWSENEIQLFSSKDMKLYSLGPQVLRAETAAIVSTGILLLG